MIEIRSIKIRRFFALAIDILAVITIGVILGTLLQKWLIIIGDKSYYVGFFIALFYHGLSNSLYHNGQTLGKAVMHLRVINKRGKRINPVTSLFRSIPVVLYFLWFPNNIPDSLETLLIVICIPPAVGLAYLSLFSKGNRC